ncbi:hypothetical protein F5148DRAFT_1148204 [Russula earlei]|uniref:Uncharacterized protein n=1 Tax=Russula earlei TaxID=71964 RepID=A0ACC0UDF4_9AGAM|nr:hypothetical protein F5148DRAFT_1148204 [Russula earlei]
MSKVQDDQHTAQPALPIMLLNLEDHLPNGQATNSTYMLLSNSEVRLMMELCKGKSLATVREQIQWRKGHVGEKVMQVLAEEVLEGLAYLHFKKVIHWDIKPSNILLS